VVHGAVILVGQGGVGVNALDGLGDLPFGRARIGRRLTQPFSKFISPGRQILGDVIEHLRPRVCSDPGPGRGLVCRLDRVPNVLPVSLPHFAEPLALRVEHRQAVPGIGPSLFPGDIELWSTIDRGQESGRGGKSGRGGT
jgi:hypothetical protein